MHTYNLIEAVVSIKQSNNQIVILRKLLKIYSPLLFSLGKSCLVAHLRIGSFRVSPPSYGFTRIVAKYERRVRVVRGDSRVQL